jgi:nitroreductase
MVSRTHSRREALARGGALMLSVAGGLLRPADAEGRVLPEGDAYAPWTLWGDPSLRQTPFALVAAAVLAANPHDTQPWLFRVRDERIDVLADLSRNLGAMDPFVREMHLGLGCAIENMVVAAGPNGFEAEVEAVEGSLLDLVERRGPVAAASLRLKERAPIAPDALYDAIALRHTNRYAYERVKPPPADWLDAAGKTAAGHGARLVVFDGGDRRRAFDAAVIEATQAIIDDKTMIGDSDSWFRSSRAEIDAHRDGPTLEAAGLSVFVLTYARLFAVSPETSHAAWLANTRDTQLASAPLTGLIAVRDRYDRKSALAAGRVWQSLHLSATAGGLALQPLNQPIEMVDRERQTGQGDAWAKRIAGLTGDDWQATFAFRAGYASHPAPASPRRRLADVVTP